VAPQQASHLALNKRKRTMPLGLSAQSFTPDIRCGFVAPIDTEEEPVATNCTQQQQVAPRGWQKAASFSLAGSRKLRLSTQCKARRLRSLRCGAEGLSRRCGRELAALLSRRLWVVCSAAPSCRVEVRCHRRRLRAFSAHSLPRRQPLTQDANECSAACGFCGLITEWRPSKGTHPP
jgi:hypothetical protein